MSIHSLDQGSNIAERILADQNMVAGLVAGAIASVLAAFGIGVTSSIWEYSYGFVVIGGAILIGLAVQYLGRGVSNVFAFIASSYTVAACIFGNTTRLALLQARIESVSAMDALTSPTTPSLVNRVVSNFSLVDFLYLFVAVWCAAFLAKRPLSRTESFAIRTHLKNELNS